VGGHVQVQAHGLPANGPTEQAGTLEDEIDTCVAGDDTSRIGIGWELPGWWSGPFPPVIRAHALNYHTATTGLGHPSALAKGWM
jgi:hypothetical protein